MSDASLPVIVPPGKPGESPPPAPIFKVRPPRFWRLRRFVASLDPTRLFLGPVFWRDMSIIGRRKTTYLVRFAVLLVPTLFVALILAANASRSAWTLDAGSAAGRIQAMQDTAFDIAATVAWCQLIMLALIAPLLTAGTVVEERTARALSVIAASPLSAGRVIGGLFAARMVQVGILALLPVPLLLAIRLFGGLETEFILWSWSIAVCNAVAVAAVGVWSSTRATRPAGAVSFAIMFLIAYWAAAPLVVLLEVLYKEYTTGVGGMPTTLPAFVACPPAMLVLLGSPMTGAFFGFTTTDAAAVNCGISLSLATGALLLARKRLAWMVSNDQADLVKPPSRRQRRKAARKATLPDGQPDSSEPALALAHGSREITGNPVLWREMRQSLFAGPVVRWLGIVGLLGLVVFLHLMTIRYDNSDIEALAVVPSIVAVVLVLLSAATTPAGAVTTELEARTWSVLLTTPLSATEILLPKVLGAMRRCWPGLAFAMVNLLLCALRGIAPVWALLFTLLHFVVFAFFLCCTGVYFSLTSRKSAVASTKNIVLAFVLWLLAPIAVGIVSGMSRGSDDAIGFFLLTNPVFTYGSGLVEICDSRNYGGSFRFGPLSLTWFSFHTLWLLTLAAYTSLGWAVLWHAKARFERLSTLRV